MPNAPQAKGTLCFEDESRTIFDGRMQRIMRAFNARSDSELARALGIKPQSVAAARQRLQIPSGWIEKTSTLTETTTDWLFFGRGPVRHPSCTPRGDTPHTNNAHSDTPHPHNAHDDNAHSCAQNIAPHGTQHRTHFSALPPAPFAPQATIATPASPSPLQAATYAPPLAALSPTPHQELVMIPRVAPHLAAGAGFFNRDAETCGHFAFRADWARRKGSPNHMVLMNVTGDSMLPRIENGDMVLIDQSKTGITAYGIYAVSVENVLYIRQVYTGPGQIILHSLNPAFEDIVINTNAEQPECVRILGRVLWCGREYV